MASAISATAETRSIEPVRARAMRRRLMSWYGAYGRHTLDWRQTCDPYAVLASEMMLQQTQVERVLPYYREWLARWPDVADLASAPTAEVIRAWAGLGYNRRAVNLKRAAEAIVDGFDGRFPPGREALQTLPGVGPYTAAAVACFAFGQRVPVLDTNVARVLARAAGGREEARGMPVASLKRIAGSLLPPHGARDHNLALMDLGALVCRSRQPDCDACPLRRDCAWLAAGRPSTGRRQHPVAAFETTARFGRGRVLHELREARGPLALEDLAQRLPAAHHGRARGYLEALEREGLAVITAEGWTLP